MKGMGSISSISNALFSPLSLSTSASGATTSTSDVSGSDNTDKHDLSPLAKLLSQLQDLQQSDPSKYKDITAQIATKLKAAAQSAEASGDSAGAKQLNQLATDFTDASTSGQLPKIDDLAHAVHHGHGHHGPPPPPPDDSNTDNSDDNSTSQIVNQLLKAYQANLSSNSASTDPLKIIFDTLNGSGAATS